MTFKLDKVQARLKPFRTIRSMHEGRGEGAPVEVTELELAIDIGGEGVDDESFDKAIVELFGPTVLTQIKGVPGRGAGFDLTSRSKVPDVAITFFPTPDVAAFVIPPSLSSVIRSRPKLKVNEEGDPTLELRRVVYRPRAEDVAKLHPYIGADFFVSMEEVQTVLDMGEGTTATAEPAAVARAGTKTRKGQLALADGGTAKVEPTGGEGSASA